MTPLRNDAVCVNQENLHERSQQVKFVDQVYTGAQQVIAYLGTDEGGDARLAFDILHKKWDWYTTQLAKHLQLERIPALSPSWFQPKETAAWRALARIIDLPWFGRTLVTQEVGLAKDCTIFCGYHECSKAVLADISGLLLSRDPFLPQTLALQLEWYGLWQAWGPQHSGTMSFLDMLSYGRQTRQQISEIIS